MRPIYCLLGLLRVQYCVPVLGSSRKLPRTHCGSTTEMPSHPNCLCQGGTRAAVPREVKTLCESNIHISAIVQNFLKQSFPSFESHRHIHIITLQLLYNLTPSIARVAGAPRTSVNGFVVFGSPHRVFDKKKWFPAGFPVDFPIIRLGV